MGAIGDYITKKVLRNSAKKHIRNYPRLAMFAFDSISSEIIIFGQHEREELKFLGSGLFPKLKKRICCFDVGANIGNHSLEFAKHFEHVYSFEPNPYVYDLLNINASLTNNIITKKIGLSNSQRTVKIQKNKYETNLGSTKIEEKALLESKDFYEFKLMKLDQFVKSNKIKDIDYIKIDIEGHELECIMGAEHTLRSFSPILTIEILKVDIFEGKTNAIKLLKEYGYKFFYELVDSSWLNRLPVSLYKLVRFSMSILINKKLKREYTLKPINSLEPKNYTMVVCSKKQISDL